MDYQSENKKFWDEHFSKVSLDYPNEEVIRFLAKNRKVYPGGRMLDWGCATGRHTVLACKMGYEVIAADYVKRCIDITKEKVEKECTDYSGKVVSYIVNKDVDIENLDDNSLDIILAFGIMTLNGKAEQQCMLRNMSRMLKTGGRVFADFRTQKDTIYEIAMQENENLNGGFYVKSDELSVKGNYVCILSLQELEEMIENSGLSVENVELCEFTENNRKRKNSWWHITMIKA